MSVYVDWMRDQPKSAEWRYGATCRMWADTLDELYEMAGKLGLKRRWLHDKEGFPHFDLVHTKKLKALRLGVVNVDKGLFEKLLENQKRRK